MAKIVDLQSFRAASNQARADARDRLLDNSSLRDGFVEENPGGFREQDLSLVVKWHHFQRGPFIIERDLKDHTVFLGMEEPMQAYGVLGLTQEIVDIVRYPLPASVDAVLLPWKGRIVCDGLILVRGIEFGRRYRQDFKRSYREARARGIITSLEPGRQPEPPKPRQLPKTPAIQRFLREARCQDADPVSGSP